MAHAATPINIPLLLADLRTMEFVLESERMRLVTSLSTSIDPTCKESDDRMYALHLLRLQEYIQEIRRFCEAINHLRSSTPTRREDEEFISSYEKQHGANYE